MDLLNVLDLYSVHCLANVLSENLWISCCSANVAYKGHVLLRMVCLPIYIVFGEVDFV